MFHTRLGLTVIDAAGGMKHPAASRIAASLIHRTIESLDGYAARELLAHDGCAAVLSDDQPRDLDDILDASTLGRREIRQNCGPHSRLHLPRAKRYSHALSVRKARRRPGFG